MPLRFAHPVKESGSAGLLQFEVLGLVRVVPAFGPYWFNGYDVDEERERGVLFAAWEDDAEVRLATLQIADITADPDELNVDTLNEETAKEFDRFLEGALRREVGELHSWAPSKLIPVAGRMSLLSAYSGMIGEAEWRAVVRRFTVADRRFGLMGTWESSRSAYLAEPIYKSIMQTRAAPMPRGKQH